MCRATFYLPQELLEAIDSQAQTDKSSRSHFVTTILFFLLLSPTGRELRANAKANNRLLVQELENYIEKVLNENKTKELNGDINQRLE